MTSAELRIAMGDDLTVSADATKKAYEVVVWGLGETLTRVTPEGHLVPWLAQDVRNIDPVTWQVTLRENATFWDGTPVTAEAVAGSIRTNWEVQNDTRSLIDPDTELRVLGDRVLAFRTLEPIGNLPHALSYQQFVVHKDHGRVLTGPYRTVRCTPGESLELEAFRGHWDGPPPVSKITISVVGDHDERLRRLRDGEADLVYGLPPETLDTLDRREYDVSSIPSKKLHFVQMNHRKGPFVDRDVREAMSCALDRDGLLKAALNGHGAVATGMFPSYSGLRVVGIQTGDADRATQLLDSAGWRPGPDGILRRNGETLSFDLISFPQRREMTTLAHAIADQLRPFGFDITVDEQPNIVAATKDGNFTASMRSINSLVTGDPYFLLRAMLSEGGRSNQGGYLNPDVERLLDCLRVETNPAGRQDISAQLQETQRHDVSNVFLFFVPITLVSKRGTLPGFEPDWNNEYLIKNTFSVAPRD